MTYTFDDSIVSDLHKDAHGHRPREGFWTRWNSYTDEQKQYEWDCLIRESEESAEREKFMQEEALTAFEARVAQGMEAGATRTQAIRWILQAEGLEDERDAGFICYSLGLSYDHESMFKEFVK